MKEYLLDDSFFEELIRKDKKSVIPTISECKTNTTNKGIVNGICGFDVKKICNASCKYYSSCSRRSDKRVSVYKKENHQDLKKEN